MSTHNAKIAAALRLLADALETDSATDSAEASTPADAEPTRRGRGRRAAAETPPATAPAQPNSADPFAEPTGAALTTTIEEVRTALTELKNATTQENALKVLKDASGVGNLTELQQTPAKYGAVVKAAKAAMPGAAPAADPDDPFAMPAAEAEKVPTIEEVKEAVVAAQKRTGADTVQKVVMKHGGQAAGPTGVMGPSLKALPVANYAACLKEISELPTTK